VSPAAALPFIPGWPPVAQRVVVTLPALALFGDRRSLVPLSEPNRDDLWRTERGRIV